MAVNWGKVDIQQLEPELYADLKELLEELPHMYFVSEGFRSLERSKQLNDAYVADPKKNPRAAPPGKSAHNFGLAVDVMLDGDPIKKGIQPDWNTVSNGWKDLIKAVKKHPRLHSLHNVGDWPHIEKVQWQKFKNWRNAGGA